VEICRVREGNATNLPRRQFLRLAAGVVGLPVASRFANAQSYPSRPIAIKAEANNGSFHAIKFTDAGEVVAGAD
jgi:hypothetical protein